MDSLVYSLNATVPVFLIIVLGYFLRRIGLLDEGFVKVSNAFNFKVSLPALLFCDMAQAQLREEFDPKLVVFCAVTTTVMFFGIWLLARLILKDKAMIGAYVHASYRSSVAVLGIAFISNIYGNAGMAPQMILGAVPLFNIYAVVVLTLESGQRGSVKENVRKACKGIVGNPILIGLVLGMLVSYIGLDLPPVMDKALSLVGSMATPQALLCIGAGFEGSKAIQKLLPTCGAAFTKLVALPAIFGTAAIVLGFRGQALLTILIMLGSPTTPSSYVMTQNMGGDGVLASSAIVTTTLLSAFTLTVWIFLYRQLGFL